MDIAFKGIITGLLLSIFVGATFFMLIETSMSRGFKAALWFDAGVVLCDISIIVAVYFFTSWITHTIIRNEYFSLASGMVFFAFGVNYILFRHKKQMHPTLKNENAKLFLNGFIINLMNPSVFLFWFGTMALTISKFNYTGRETFTYYASAIITMTIFDVLKVYFAYKLSNFINSKILRIIYIFMGVFMIGLGIYFIFKK